MLIELLYTPGCAIFDETRALLQSRIDSLCPEAELCLVPLSPEQTREQQGFYGSPSVRIDGADLEGLSGPPSGAT